MKGLDQTAEEKKKEEAAMEEKKKADEEAKQEAAAKKEADPVELTELGEIHDSMECTEEEKVKNIGAKFQNLSLNLLQEIWEYDNISIIFK